MDNCIDCAKRDRQSLAKPHNQANVQGTRVCRNDCCLLLFEPNEERKFVYCLFVFSLTFYSVPKSAIMKH